MPPNLPAGVGLLALPQWLPAFVHIGQHHRLLAHGQSAAAAGREAAGAAAAGAEAAAAAAAAGNSVFGAAGDLQQRQQQRGARQHWQLPQHWANCAQHAAASADSSHTSLCANINWPCAFLLLR